MRSGTRTQASARTVVISISTDKYANVPRPKTEIYRRTDANTYKGIQLKTHQMPRAPAPDRRSFCVEAQRRNRQRHHHKRLLTNVALRFRDSIVGIVSRSQTITKIFKNDSRFLFLLNSWKFKVELPSRLYRRPQLEVCRSLLSPCQVA